MIKINPKLLRHKEDGNLYAFLGYSELGWRFGSRIHLARVIWSWWIFYWVGNEFSESIDFYERPK